MTDPLVVRIPYYRQVPGYILEQESSGLCRLAKYTRSGDYTVIAQYVMPSTEKELDTVIRDIRRKHWKKRLFVSVRILSAEEQQALRDEEEYLELLLKEMEDE